MNLFDANPRAKRSHGHQIIQHPNVTRCSKPRPLQYTFIDLLSNIQKPLGIHHIRVMCCRWLSVMLCLFLLDNGIWRKFLLLSWRGSDRTGLERRKDATSHITLDNLYLGEKGSNCKLRQHVFVWWISSTRCLMRLWLLNLCFLSVYNLRDNWLSFIKSFFHFILMNQK
jgi:hypothetical protein